MIAHFTDVESETQRGEMTWLSVMVELELEHHLTDTKTTLKMFQDSWWPVVTSLSPASVSG